MPSALPFGLSLLALAAALSGSACGAAHDGHAAWAGSVTDSSGVTLIRNPAAPLWTPTQAWWVDETMALQSHETDPATLLGYVVDVAVDDQGRLFVLDQRARAVRVFGADGTYLRTLGGAGAGPGGLGPMAASVVIQDGEVWVADWSQGRLVRYLRDGTQLASLRLPHAAGARSWWKKGMDGGVYFRTLSMAPAEDGSRTSRDHLLRVKVASEGTGGDGAWTTDTLLAFTYRATDSVNEGAGGLPLVVNAPAWAVLADGTVAWTTLDANEVRLRDPAGRETRIRSDGWVSHDPTDSEIAALSLLIKERQVMLGGRLGTVDEVVVDVPDALPVLTDLFAGPAGTLWVQRAGPVREVHPMALSTPAPPRGWGGTVWEVLSPEGRYLGSLELLPRFRVMVITDSTVVGVQSDRNRVDRVMVLTLHRPGGKD